METDMNDFDIDMIEVEKKARQLRAEATRDALKAIATRFRALFAHKATQRAH